MTVHEKLMRIAEGKTFITTGMVEQAERERDAEVAVRLRASHQPTQLME